MTTDLANAYVPLDWFWGLKINIYIPSRDKVAYDEIHARAKQILGPVFERLPEFEITDSLVFKFNERSKKYEIYYQPVLQLAPQKQLNLDPYREANLPRVLREFLEEFKSLPTILLGLLKAEKFKSLDTLSDADQIEIKVLREILDSRLSTEFTAGGHTFKTGSQQEFRQEATFKFHANVQSVGRDFVKLEKFRPLRGGSLPFTHRTLHVHVRTGDLWGEECSYFDKLCALLESNEKATFTCEIALGDLSKRNATTSATLMRLDTFTPE